MCDTFCLRTGNHVIFAKNSDRHPAERQYSWYALDAVSDYEDPSSIEFQRAYRNLNWDLLGKALSSYENPYGALVSTPSWLWGAEMGVNTQGVAIGNEAVFTHREFPYHKAGLLGMDILRLVLHNAGSAKDALEMIIELISTYSQGGNGAYRGKMYYHNSFLITDGKDTYVLETADSEWAWKHVEGPTSISNTFTIRRDHDASNCSSAIDFKEHHQDPLYTFFSQADKRVSYSRGRLLGRFRDSVPEMRRLCRSHISGSRHTGMNSICIHSGPFIKSATTASLIVDYQGGRCQAWSTNSPYPCSSLYQAFPVPTTEKEISLVRDSALPTSRKSAVNYRNRVPDTPERIAAEKDLAEDIRIVMRKTEAILDERTLGWYRHDMKKNIEAAEICYTEIQRAYIDIAQMLGGQP